MEERLNIFVSFQQKSNDPLHKPAAENMGDRAEQEKLRPIIRKCYGSLAEFIKAIDYHLKVAKENEDLDRVRRALLQSWNGLPSSRRF